MFSKVKQVAEGNRAVKSSFRFEAFALSVVLSLVETGRQCGLEELWINFTHVENKSS